MANKEKAIGDAASALLAAIEDGAKDGLVVAWPQHWRDLDGIAVSQTAKARVVVQTDSRSVSPEVAEKAASAAQKAADKEVEKAVKA